MAAFQVQRVFHEPGWRGVPFVLNYLLLEADPQAEDLIDIYRWARDNGLENPRAIFPRARTWASLFQPNLAAAIGDRDPGLRCADPDLAWLSAPRAARRFWLQSIVFLAAVTLSAAIVQARWSRGTLESKLDRLWQAASSPVLAGEIDAAWLRGEIAAIAHSTAPPIERLLAIRRLFGTLIERLASDVPATRTTVGAGPRAGDPRFGFAAGLADRFADLRGVVVYGSSVSSADFADIDAVVVLDNPEVALRALEGAAPTWQGKELNLGIYSPQELWAYQLLSGDNLGDYGECVFGSVELPVRDRSLLLARNCSFGVVRQRQQLGMLARAGEPADPADDRQNLFHYFVKIPANVAKGTFGAAGLRRTKTEVNGWLRRKTGFDAASAQAEVMTGSAELPLARAALATLDALVALNAEFKLVEPNERVSA